MKCSSSKTSGQQRTRGITSLRSCKLLMVGVRRIGLNAGLYRVDVWRMKDPGMKLRMEAPVITLGMEEPSSKFGIEDPGRV